MAHFVRQGRINVGLDRADWWRVMLRAEELAFEFTDPVKPNGAREEQVKLSHRGGYVNCQSITEASEAANRTEFDATMIEFDMARSSEPTMHGVDRRLRASVAQINIDPIGVFVYEVSGNVDLDVNGFATVLEAAIKNEAPRTAALEEPPEAANLQVSITRVEKSGVITRAWQWVNGNLMSQIVGGLVTVAILTLITWLITRLSTK